jgi:acetyl esterase/lipase
MTIITRREAEVVTRVCRGAGPAGAVPARVQNLAGLPATFIGVGSLDLFVDEDVEYARRLIEAGVPTQLLVIPAAFHGFDGIAPESTAASQFRLGWNTVLKRALAPNSLKRSFRKGCNGRDDARSHHRPLPKP